MSEGASWHAKFKDSAYIFAGGLSFDLTEGDILAVFSQYGEIVDVNLVRNEETGKSRGFAFICYEDQRSTVLAVDNLNGAKVLGRTIKVEHVEDYRLKDEEAAKKKDWKCGCGAENFKFRDNCLNVEVLAHHSRSRRTTETILQESMLDLPRKDGDTMGFERTRRAPPRVNLRRGRVRHSRQLPTRMMMMQSSENLKHAKRLQWRGQGLPHRVCPFQVVARMEHPGEKRRGPRKRRSPRRRKRRRNPGRRGTARAARKVQSENELMNE